jgi:very-long-chain enoyl-CoA reductase
VFDSSAHYHLGSGMFLCPRDGTQADSAQGLALAYSIYSPVYGATSPYIRGTVRNDPLYIQAGAAIWLVRALWFRMSATPTERARLLVVLRNF